MSNELIEKLQAAAVEFGSGSLGELMRQAVDALESKAEPVAEQEREHTLALIGHLEPTDANLSAMRRDGLSIDGDNAYKRDLLDCIVGALAFGKQGVNPPPAGHWAQQFWEMGNAERLQQLEELERQQAREVVSDAARDVLAERERQISAEGWTPEHDDEHAAGTLADAAACYARHAAGWDTYSARNTWPWSLEWWKPSTPRRDLIKAGALILAEIERLDRLNGQECVHDFVDATNKHVSGTDVCLKCGKLRPHADRLNGAGSHES